MSFLGKINKFCLDKTFRTNYFLIQCANYSRKSDSKKTDSPYKVVKSRVRFEDENGWLASEGSPNWELFAPKGNRFYLPGMSGPAWQNASTTISPEFQLEDLIDFNSKQSNKLHINTKECPILLRNNLHELFPAPEVVQPSSLTLITLSYRNELEAEKGAKSFVLAAREICSRLRLNGFWADFMNPFSGKPFHSYSSGKNLYKIDDRFRGLGIKFEKLNECTIISSDEDFAFSGNVFTNAPSDFSTLQSLLMD